MWLAGSKHRAVWYLALFFEVLWTYYSVAIHQFGLLLSCPIFVAIYIRNIRKWSHGHND